MKLSDAVRKIVMPIVWQRHLMKNVAEESRQRALQTIAQATPDNPALSGFRIYSQSDEDGIIQEIFRRLGGGKTFLEIGCGDGLENNSVYLLLKGWSGTWVDGNSRNIRVVKNRLNTGGRLSVRELMVDVENVKTLPLDVDFLSLDIDGNDLAVLKSAVSVASPRVICVEYNAKFPPPLDITIVYNPGHVWQGNDYQGASLQAFVNALPDYTLVCCGLAGLNAFFVRKDEMAVFSVYEPSQLYRPYHFELFYPYSGHPPSHGFLADSLRNDPAH